MFGTCSSLLVLVLCSLGTAIHPIKFPSLNHEESSIIIYEAEKAFVNVNAREDARSQCELVGIKWSGGSAVELISESYVIFTVNIPEDGVYAVSLSAYSCGAQSSSLDIFANGLPLLVGSDLVLDNMGVVLHDLTLRTGINTIKYQIYGGSVVFDFITVKGGLPLATRGATVTYEEIEAESASYQAALIGPGRQYCTLPSEASGRMAVQLKDSGNYVEFTPTKSFNAIVVRFSIPNSDNGVGQATNLDLLVNGKQVTVLNITSYYSWTYGSYPFYRNPGQGNPHHFYDDVRFAFGTSYPAGTKVRLTGATTVIITIDLADFYTIPAPYTQPANYISVVDYGADPTGQKDSGGAFQQAFDAFNQKKPAGMWIPAGKYLFTYRLNLQTSFVIRGAGPWYTELHGHDFGFDGQNSNNVGLYDFAVFGTTNVRVDSEVSAGVGSSLNSAQVQNLWIEHDKCGMWLDGPFNGLLITGVTIRNTFADGINFHFGVTNSVVEQTIVRNAGDDCLAMWPQASSSYGSNVFRFNTLSIPVLANTIAIYGGTNNSATDNYCADTVVEGAGLQTGTRFGSMPLSGTTTFARNTLVRTGSGDMYNPASHVEGAIWLYADSGNINTPIVFEDITITDAYFQAVEFFQGSVSNVNFTNIQVNGAKYLWDTLVSVSIYAQGVVATNITTSVNNCNNQPFSITQGPGNSGWSTSDTKCEQ
jgi:hypothetical protein